jgi:hypothetical protein
MTNQVSVITNLIFRAVDGAKEDNPNDHNIYYGKNGVAWILRFGGLCTIIAYVLSARYLVQVLILLAELYSQDVCRQPPLRRP